MEHIYLLTHSYDLEDDYGTHEEFKLIGVFSSEAKAQQAIKKLICYPGFKDYSVDCFSINEYTLDQVNWEEGFDTYRYREYD